MNRFQDELLTGVIRACREASAAILDVYAHDFDVATKSDDSPLTAADLASHRVLSRALRALTPDIPVLSEESAAIETGRRLGWERLWVVDPLDGTREFVKRNGEFTINVALVEKQRAVLGVIAIPVADRIYAAHLEQGAWRLDGDGPPRPISTRVPPANPPRVLGSRSHANERTRTYLEQLGEHELLGRGSALKFCAVAEGEADLYPRLGPTSEWDTAAGHCIVEAAGGSVTRADGGVMRYNARETLLNPEFLVSGDPSYAWPRPDPSPPAESR